MKKIWVKAAASVLAAAMVFPLASCSGQKAQGTPSGGSKQETVVIAAAASLKNVLDRELIPRFERENPGLTVKGSYDSSGKLQTQIEEGLGADLFFSAATRQMNALKKEGLMDNGSITDLLENKLVLIVPKNSSYSLHKFQDVTKCKAIAVGDPASVPAGQYAKASLTKLGIWDSIGKKLSLGTNVTEVLNWVAEDSADCGFVYATDAASEQGKVKVCATAPDSSLSSPILYPAGLTKASARKAGAQKFLAFLKSDEAMNEFVRYGFSDYRKK